MTTAVASKTADRQQRKRELEEHFAADFSTLAYPLLADIYYQGGDLVRARKVCRIGLKYHPGHSPGLYLLALVNMREGQMEAAEDLLDRTLAQDPYHVEAAEYLGLKPQTLACWASTRRYPLAFVKVGSRVMYDLVELDRWLTSRTVGAFDGAAVNS